MALLAELRAHERQAAEELGQRVERQEEHNGVNLVELLNGGRERAGNRPSEGLSRRRRPLRTVEG